MLAAVGAEADTIHRTGAMPVTGTVIRISDERVEYRPAAGDVFNILPRRGVTRIEFDNGFVDEFDYKTIRRRDRSRVRGTVTGIDEAGLRVVPMGESTPVTIPAGDIATIEFADMREFTFHDLLEAAGGDSVAGGMARLVASKRGYVRTYGDRVMVRGTLVWKHLALFLNDRRYSGGAIDLWPTVQVYGAVAVTWRTFTLSYGMSAADLTKKFSIVPRTFDTQANWEHQCIAVEGWFQHYQGYRANDALFNRSRSGSSMSSWAGGVTVSLLFSRLGLNRTVSLATSFQQSGRQLASGFVYGPFIGGDYYRFKSRYPFVHPLDPVFTILHLPMEFYGCTGVQVAGFSLGAQVGGTLVWRGWYVTALYLLGFAPLETILTYTGWRKHDVSAGNWRMSLRLAGGYNGDRVFAGVFGIGELLNISFRGKGGIIELEKQNAGFFAGVRL